MCIKLHAYTCLQLHDAYACLLELQAGLIPRIFAYLFDRIEEIQSKQVRSLMLCLPKSHTLFTAARLRLQNSCIHSLDCCSIKAANSCIHLLHVLWSSPVSTAWWVCVCVCICYQQHSTICTPNHTSALLSAYHGFSHGKLEHPQQCKA